MLSFSLILIIATVSSSSVFCDPIAMKQQHQRPSDLGQELGMISHQLGKLAFRVNEIKDMTNREKEHQKMLTLVAAEALKESEDTTALQAQQLSNSKTTSSSDSAVSTKVVAKCEDLIQKKVVETQRPLIYSRNGPSANSYFTSPNHRSHHGHRQHHQAAHLTPPPPSQQQHHNQFDYNTEDRLRMPQAVPQAQAMTTDIDAADSEVDLDMEYEAVLLNGQVDTESTDDAANEVVPLAEVAPTKPKTHHHHKTHKAITTVKNVVASEQPAKTVKKVKKEQAKSVPVVTQVEVDDAEEIEVKKGKDEVSSVSDDMMAQQLREEVARAMRHDEMMRAQRDAKMEYERNMLMYPAPNQQLPQKQQHHQTPYAYQPAIMNQQPFF